MNQKEIKELIEFLVEKDIAEFELQRGDMKLLIKRGASPQPAADGAGRAGRRPGAYSCRCERARSRRFLRTSASG